VPSTTILSSHSVRDRKRREEREQRLEDACLGRLAARGGAAEPGQHRGEPGSQRVGQGVEGGVAVAEQRP
jgi:hypothetical protein